MADATQEGLVTAIKSGSTVITATSTKDSSIVAECSVTVITPVTGIEIDKTELKIKVGYSDQLTAWALPGCKLQGISWSSSNDRLSGFSIRRSKSGNRNGCCNCQKYLQSSVKVECKLKLCLFR